MYPAFDHDTPGFKPAANLFRLGLRKPEQPKSELPQLSQKFSAVMCRNELMVGGSGKWERAQLPARLEVRKGDGNMPQEYRQVSLGRRPAYRLRQRKRQTSSLGRFPWGISF
ncbi:MAG: hypothetical protein Q9224_002083 [Gallowayella concinna]